MHSRGFDPYQARKKRLKNWLILLGAAAAVALVVTVFVLAGKSGAITAARLPCLASQGVTPFGEYILYYDGMSIQCLNAGGGVRWTVSIGAGGGFHAGTDSVVAWVNNQLYILDKNGHTTYNDNVGDTVQFARVGERYAAAVIGDETNPTLIIKDLNGSSVDEETEAFAGLCMLDVGFYGDQGQYMWTLALDVFGTAANTVMNTFEVGKMNTGVISLGEPIVYKVLYENGKLRVISTRQMRTFNYQGIEDAAAAMLVYGWRLIASEIPSKGDARMLFAPTAQTNSQYQVSELRLLSGASDRRFTLPGTCVGATLYNNQIYAFSSQYIYRAGVKAQRFSALETPLDGQQVTGFLGMLSSGQALVACGDTVYSIHLPKS